MITNKHIMSAQQVLRKLEGTPIIVRPDNTIQVTYDHDTYRALFEVIVAVAETPVYDTPISVTPYHREKV